MFGNLTGQPNHNDTSRWRATRVLLGTIMTLGGLCGGLAIATKQMRQSLAVDQPPVRMSCVELLREGLPEQTSLVFLTDAMIVPPGPAQIPGWLGADDSARAMRAQAILSDPRVTQLMDRLVQGSVMPRGARTSGNHQPLKLSRGRQLAEQVADEVAREGGLLAHVSRDSSQALTVWLADQLGMSLPEAFIASAKLPTYRLHPASQIESQSTATIWLVGSLLAVSLGLVCCGSVSWGWWIVLSPLGAVIGLPGILLRNPRVGTAVASIHFLVGLGLLGVAAGLVGQPSLFGLPAALDFPDTFAFLAASFGLAAVLGTYLNRRWQRRRMADSDLAVFGSTPAKPTRAKRGQKGKGRSNSQVGEEAVMPSRPNQLEAMIQKQAYTRRYLDPRLSVSSKPELDEEITRHTAALAQHDFDEPLVIEIARGEDTADVTVQVGCRDLVLAMTERLDENEHLRFMSVLEDGHLVVSVNETCVNLCDNVAGECATINVYQARQATKLLAKHLDVAGSVATRRRTTLLRLDHNEWRDVILFSERCLADALHHAGLQKWDISEASYGRFHYPPMPVPVATMV